MEKGSKGSAAGNLCLRQTASLLPCVASLPQARDDLFSVTTTLATVYSHLDGILSIYYALGHTVSHAIQYCVLVSK
eukprot:6180524-Pleurochrysis_carterae.AAC.6